MYVLRSMVIVLVVGMLFSPAAEAYRPMKGLGKGSRVNLMNWAWNHRKLKHVRVEKYSRKKHFSRWVDADRDCQDARQEVLIRDSYVKPLMKNSCRVKKGLWFTPYSGFEIDDPQELEVDHLVPLLNAYYNGAAHWSQAKRCHFQNFLGYPGHLFAVESMANTMKSALNPAHWLPQNKAFRCEYLKHWVLVKVIWKLTFPVKEFQGILKALKAESCLKNTFSVLKSEILRYRALAKQISPSCSRKTL